MHTRGLAVHSLVDFQLGVKLDSISLPGICTESSVSILLWWFFLFYVLVFKIFCAVGALCMFSYF